MNTVKKMMFSIEAVIHNESGTKAIQGGTWTFFRPYCTKTPTYRGAARMIAKSCDSKPLPKNVSILRIQSNVCESR
jgi:hypothetical protein